LYISSAITAFHKTVHIYTFINKDFNWWYTCLTYDWESFQTMVIIIVLQVSL